MKGLATLIKLHKRTLDGLRRQMGALEGQKAALLKLSAKLYQDLEDEMRLAGSQPEMAHFFGDFAQRMKKKQEDIATEVKKLDQQMAKLTDKIAIEFSELKKYEIALDNAKKRKQEEEKRRETILLDEMASQQHRRKQEAE